MGISLEQAFSEARKLGLGAVAKVKVTTNQDNGIVSYATGALFYSPEKSGGSTSKFAPESFTTKRGQELNYLFSDRTSKIGPPPPPGSFDLRENQPFDFSSKDKLGLSIVNDSPSVLAKFTLVSHGNWQFELSLQPLANVMFGAGPPIGAGSAQAVYTIAVYDISKPMPPKIKINKAV